jgi:hypothetical protein
MVLYNAMGKKVAEQLVTMLHQETKTVFPVSHLAKGMYLIRLQAGARVTQRKILVE